MIKRLFRVCCDRCGCYATTEAVDETEAMRKFTRTKWCERDMGYGNWMQYCSQKCREDDIREGDSK